MDSGVSREHTVFSRRFVNYIYTRGTQEEQKIWNKRARKALLVSAILLIVAVLMPSSTTLTKMIIAQQITPNNITTAKELTTEVMKDTVNFIADKAIEIIKEVKK